MFNKAKLMRKNLKYKLYNWYRWLYLLIVKDDMIKMKMLLNTSIMIKYSHSSLFIIIFSHLPSF